MAALQRAAAAAARRLIGGAQQQQQLPAASCSARGFAAAAAAEPEREEEEEQLAGPSGRAASATTRREYLALLHQYNRERAEWRRQMTALRKVWLREHRRREAGEAAERAAAAAAARSRALEQQAQMAEALALQRKLREVKDAEAALGVAQANLARATRDGLRAGIVAEHRGVQRQRLLQESRGWIAREDFDAAIAAALDAPARFDFTPPRPPGREAAPQPGEDEDLDS